MDFLKRYKKMISLRGLTDHTVKSYCTYISAYLDYISNTLHKYPSQVTYNDIRAFLENLQMSRGLSDRTINCAISQLRFFTLYVLHKPWDPTQIPMRKFDTYLPYVPSQEEALYFIDTIPDIKVKAMVALMYSSGLRVGEVCNLRYEDIQGKNKRIHITHVLPPFTAKENSYSLIKNFITGWWMIQILLSLNVFNILILV